jgi:hypothetical protein
MRFRGQAGDLFLSTRYDAKNRRYRIEPITHEIPHGTDVFNVSMQRNLASVE